MRAAREDRGGRIHQVPAQVQLDAEEVHRPVRPGRYPRVAGRIRRPSRTGRRPGSTSHRRTPELALGVTLIRVDGSVRRCGGPGWVLCGAGSPAAGLRASTAGPVMAGQATGGCAPAPPGVAGARHARSQPTASRSPAAGRMDNLCPAGRCTSAWPSGVTADCGLSPLAAGGARGCVQPFPAMW
jgi:hypothetical protein